MIRNACIFGLVFLAVISGIGLRSRILEVKEQKDILAICAVYYELAASYEEKYGKPPASLSAMIDGQTLADRIIARCLAQEIPDVKYFQSLIYFKDSVEIWHEACQTVNLDRGFAVFWQHDFEIYKYAVYSPSGG